VGRPVGLGSVDGADNPRKLATWLDVIAVLIVIVGLLAAVSLALHGLGSVVFYAAVTAIVSAVSTHALAVGLRWLASMYDLAARGFEPEQRIETDPQRGHERRRAA